MAMIYTLEQLAAFSARSVPGPASERLLEFACGLTLLVTDQDQHMPAESDRVHVELTCVCRDKQDEERVGTVIHDARGRSHVLDAVYTSYDSDGRVCDRMSLRIISMRVVPWKHEQKPENRSCFGDVPHWHQLRIVELECFVLYR